MIKKVNITISTILGLFLTFSVIADQVISENLIVQGGLCAGYDCVNGEAFSNDLLRLKENNTRIRFHDTSAADILGQSWNINANRSNYGGESLFEITVKSLTQDITLISDGTYSMYACPTPDPANPFLVIGTIPAGEPVLTVIANPNAPPTFICEQVLAYTEKPVLQLGIPAADFVTIGEGSSVVNNAVSVGRSGLERKLINITAGLAATDALIIQTINENDFDILSDQKSQLPLINQQLDLIDSQLNGIESVIANLESTDISKSGGGSADVLFLLTLGCLLLWHARIFSDDKKNKSNGGIFMKKFFIAPVLLYCLIAQTEVFAIDLYLGGGVSSNKLDNFGDAIGYQAFAGYDFYTGSVTIAAELGYMKSGDFDYNLDLPGSLTDISGSIESSGGWASAVTGYSFTDSLSLLGRLGYDFGDDEGAIYGIGIDYKFALPFSLRSEYVKRDDINSLQLNFVYYLGK